MNGGLTLVHSFDPAPVTTLLCDADDNLFASERPAFEASTEVVNRDVPLEQTLAQGRPAAVIASYGDLAGGNALSVDELEGWVREERERVTAHLALSLTPDPRVLEPLRDLAAHYALAAVSSSATTRLGACFAATGLDALISESVTFSAEDSLPVPTSKPDPAVYLHAGQALGVASGQGLALEDSVAGVSSAVAAGYPTVGNLMFLLPEERDCRRAELIDAGAVAITESWRALADFLLLSAVPAGGSRLA